MLISTASSGWPFIGQTVGRDLVCKAIEASKWIMLVAVAPQTCSQLQGPTKMIADHERKGYFGGLCCTWLNLVT